MSVYTPTRNGFVAAKINNLNANVTLQSILQVRAKETAVPSSPRTPPQWNEMNSSVLVGMGKALIPSELRLGINKNEAGHPPADASAFPLDAFKPKVSGVWPVDSLY